MKRLLTQSAISYGNGDRIWPHCLAARTTASQAVGWSSILHGVIVVMFGHKEQVEAHLPVTEKVAGSIPVMLA